MSTVISYGCSIFCEICSARYSKNFTITKYSAQLCDTCITEVVPRIDATYERMKQNKAKFSLYQRWFKLSEIEKIAYSRYRTDLYIEKQRQKESALRKKK
jgi:hypothetical protein